VSRQSIFYPPEFILATYQKPLESPESSSPIVTRSVAAGLQDRYFNTYHFAGWQRIALQLLGKLPQSVARFAISRFESFTGLEPSTVVDLSVNSLVSERINDYRELKGPFPAITLGSAMGGASANLSLATGGPFLPQAFVLTLRGGAKDGNIETYYRRSAELAKQLAQHNPGILTIQHYDPIHDEWMTRYVNHLRIKLLELPAAYANFIERNLEANGVVYYLDCGAKWLRYRVGEHSVFQVGGWGDISTQEFIDGSERIDIYCRRIGLQTNKWHLPEFPLETGSESEWGTESGLGESLKAFCDRKGIQFIPIQLPEPHSFSKLAFRAQAYLYQKAGRRPEGAMIEMFSQFDPTAIRKGGLLPLWLVFNTLDSLKFLESMVSEFPADKPVFFSPLATFTLTPDLVPWTKWEAVLNQFEWNNIGARPGHYPADALALTNWSAPLRSWADQQAAPLETMLNADEVLELAAAIDK
jgi:hypothetical protein